MANEYERYTPPPAAHPHSLHDFWAKFDWVGWIRVLVVCFVIVGGQLFTYSADRQKSADGQLALQQSMDRNTAALQSAILEQKALSNQISDLSKWLARVDQSKADLERRVDRMEPYVFKKAQ